ncbi:MAG: hypothetical protein HY938_06615 [Nitrosomonadales bacterium]|nr:hypothetical protein [Nitrosomonadales bacterium]
MFDITGDHIIKLNDGDLRTLVTKLCEAELRQANLPLASVTSGGDQNAADGGIDVRVELSDEAISLDFIPKGVTGFQVKKPDMQAKAIEKEMCPDGVLRPSIVQLAEKHGAYVIVSAQGSTADTPLKNRKKAMQTAAADLPDGSTLHLDFYDRDRLARWVRGYPGVTLWLRERIGEPLAGWRTYGNWAYGDPADSEYLLDDKCRIVSPQAGNHTPHTIEHGIQAMRTILENPGGIIRLVGLSGTGKTRLVQALFDSKVSGNALDRAIVIYVDQGSDQPPTPSARDMISQLAADGLRAILVVDNCNPTTHRDLVQAVNTAGGLLSLITVEYDVSDDEPEETQVFRLEPASEKVIEEILERLTPNLSQADRHRVAEFSSGNARIALALARTVKHSENLGTLKDSELFKRLFHQRKDSGEVLMRVAEVCSLVYSFDGETFDGAAAELPMLAELAEIQTKELFRHVNELRSRDLVQRRSKWRAVLPHAIANRLARNALGNIPVETLINVCAQNERLLKSFSRRLSYLHDCEQAQQIAKGWLSPQGWLCNPAKLNSLGFSLFKNIAPLAPELALQTIEAAASGENGKAFLSTETSKRWEWCGLLRSIAYEPQYFSRAALLLAKYVAEEPANFNRNSASNSFKELFHLYLSGTHALVGERLEVVRELLEADDAALNTAGMEALEGMLEVMHFTSSHDFSFGARSRDFGWEPATNADISAWYWEVVTFSKNQVAANSAHAHKIKTMLAQHFRGLWSHSGICTELEDMVRDFSAQDGWPDGWLVLRQTIRFDIDKMSSEFAARTRALESGLRPQGLAQKIQAYVLSKSHGHFDLIDTEVGSDDSNSAYESASARVYKTVEDLGGEAATSSGTLITLLPELLSGNGHMNFHFGRGLAKGMSDWEPVWQQFCAVLDGIPENERDLSLLRGFIEAVNELDPVKANNFLDAALTDPLLGAYFPTLQTAVPIDEAGAGRLVSSIEYGHVQAWQFRNLMLGRVSDPIPLPIFKQILLGIASLPKGYEVAVDVFGQRLHSIKSDKLEVDEETAALGRQLLALCNFRSNNQNDAYHINEIANACLSSEAACEETLTIAKNLARALVDYRTEARQYGVLAATLFRLQPTAAIKGFLERKQSKQNRNSLSQLFSFDRKDSPVNAAPPEILIAWAQKSRKARFPVLAQEVRLSVGSGEHGTAEWSPLALAILEMAPDRLAILNVFSSRLHPSSWSGSLSDVLLPYLGLAKKMQAHSDPQVVGWAKKQIVHLENCMEEDRKRERRVDESFE